MFKHRVDRMKKFHGDDDEGLLGVLALRLLAQVERPPLGAAADGVDRGEVEGMPGDARADGRQAGRGGPLAALGDDGIEPDSRSCSLSSSFSSEGGHSTCGSSSVRPRSYCVGLRVQ